MWHSKLALGRSKAVSSWDSISDTRQSLKLCLSHFRKKLIKNVETLCPDSQPVNTYHRSMNFNAYFWEIPIWKFLNKYLVRFRTCWAAKNLATRELLSSVLKDSLLPLASSCFSTAKNGFYSALLRGCLFWGKNPKSWWCLVMLLQGICEGKSSACIVRHL